MKLVWTMACQELRSYFDSLTAYVLLVLFLGFSGIFTWVYGSDIFMYGQASLQMFFSVAYITLFLLIPALTMRSIAEEMKTGTIEMLLTKPITCRQIVLGKYLAIIMLIAIVLALTLPYYISVSFLGNVDHGAVICGYFGLLLMSSAYAGIGLFASSITNNQIISFMLALIIGIFFHLIFGIIGRQIGGGLGLIAVGLDMNSHFDSIARGVIDSKDIVYFASLTFAGIFLAEQSLKSKIL
ncbi:MAG: ABC transporter permease subunit [Salinivirgaceae bacterium]|nr:ABC transporter permease subunit [Salinivirgaceae bacterium]